MAIKRQFLFADLAQLGTEAGKEAPTSFRLFAYGVNRSEKGDFLFDEEAAASVMKRYARKNRAKVKLTADYEHASLIPGKKAVASCSSFDLVLREDGLYADNCKWTALAKGEIESGQYRYFSPAFIYDDASMRVLGLINFGLTNLPALDDIEPLCAASMADLEDEDMPTIEELTNKVATLTAENARLVGSRGDSETVAALGAILGVEQSAGLSGLRSSVQSLVALRSDLLRETEAKTTDEAIGRVIGWKKDAAKAVAALSRVAEIEEQSLTAELDRVIADAEGKLKLTKPEVAVYRPIALSEGKVTKEGIARLKACLDVKLPVAATSGTAPRTEQPDNAGPKAGSLSQEALGALSFVKDLGFDEGDVALFNTDPQKWITVRADKRAAAIAAAKGRA
jgi:phage I-like protein